MVALAAARLTAPLTQAELANNKEDHERELQEQLQMKMGISAKALGLYQGQKRSQIMAREP